jgi:hypothetical protein
MPSPEQVILTRLEVCRLARISPSTFDRARREKRISVKRNGLRILVTRAEAMRFIEALPDEVGTQK